MENGKRKHHYKKNALKKQLLEEKKSAASSKDIKKTVPAESKGKTKKTRIRITESKIKKLLDFDHLEELFHVINLLTDSQVEEFIKHYKNSEIAGSKDKKIDSIFKKSKTKKDLIDSLKKELINSLKAEYNDLKEKISSQRKKGYDVYIEDLKSMSIPLKIKMFNATSEKNDFYKIKKIIHEVKESLEYKINQKENHKN